MARPVEYSRMLALSAIAVAAYSRWQLADLADWGIDESSNLWLASSIVSGHTVSLGLVSSRGVPNLAGAPLLATPLALLPELVGISRTLSLVHLGALGVLALTLSKRGGAPATAVATLAFFPALTLASSSVWNQYLTIPLAATMLSLLLFLIDGPTSGAAIQACALVAVALIALTLPATHLSGFADLAVCGALVTVVLVLRPRKIDMAVLIIGLLVVGAATARVYEPWVVAMIPLAGPLTFWVSTAVVAVACIGGIVLLRRWTRTAAERAMASRRAAWWCFAALCFCLGAAAILPFGGAQVGRRLLLLGRPVGFVLLASQLGIVLTFLPRVLRVHRDCQRGFTAKALLEKHFSNAAVAAASLALAVLLCAARLVLAPTLFIPGGRSDLLLSLTPALLAPLVILRQRRTRAVMTWRVGLSIFCAAGASLWLGATGLSGVSQSRFPLFVPASEMRAVVDWIAARHGAQGAGSTIDVGYDLDRGIEWITERGCRPERSWYSIGRQYDWLLKRRHGLSNVREGSCSRQGGSGWQIGYRGLDLPHGMRIVQTFEHLEIRMRVDGG